MLHYLITKLQKLNCSILYKLAFAFLLILACFIANGFISVQLLYHIRDVEEQQRTNAIGLEQIQRHSLAYQSELTLYSDTIFITNAKYIRDNFRRIITNSLAQQNEADPGATNPPDQIFESKLAELYSTAFDHFSELESLIKKGDFETAKNRWQNFTPDFNVITTLLDERQQQLEIERSSGEKDITDAIVTATVAIASITLISIALALFLLFLMEQVFIRPLNHLQQALSNVAEGKLTQPHLEVVNQDEVGKLARSFRAAILWLQQVLRGVQISENLQVVAEHLASVSKEQVAGSQKQASALAQVMMAMTELGGTASQIAENSAQVAELTNVTLVQIERVAEAGNISQEQAYQMSIVVEKTLQGVEFVGQQVAEFSQLMNGLNKQAEEIGKVVTLLNSIATEVHILSLNAAIEAAGAGEYGERFRAVAHQVKQLAGRAGQASQEAQHLISQVQLNSRNAVYQIEKGQLEVEAVVAANTDMRKSLSQLEVSAFQVTEAVSQLLNLAEQVEERAEEIKLATLHQRISNEQVIISTRSAEEVAEQTVRATQQVTVSSHQLETLIQQLSRVLGQVQLAV